MVSELRLEALKKVIIAHRENAAKLSELADDPPFPYSEEDFRDET